MQPSDSTLRAQNPGPRAPWVPLAASRRTIRLFTVATLALSVSSVFLAIVSIAQLNRKPWIIGYKNGKYSPEDPQEFRVTRDDVELFIGDVIPKLYGHINGNAPGLPLLRTMVNPNILTERKNLLDSQKRTLRDSGISEFSIVTGINPQSLVINRIKKFVYGEALGVTMLTRADKSTPTQTQWRFLLLIVDPLPGTEINTPGGRVTGNQWGLYLQQIIEQAPGTVNPDSPQPTTQDEQERQEQEMRRSRQFLPSLPELPASTAEPPEPAQPVPAFEQPTAPPQDTPQPPALEPALSQEAIAPFSSP